MGDVVQLKSGGPLMTVQELRGDNWVQCVWFSPKTDELGTGWFHPKCLMIPTP